MNKFWAKFINFLDLYVFWPNGRLVEWLSLLIMVGWIYKLATVDGYLDRDIYVGFRQWEQTSWTTVFCIGAIMHAIGIFYRSTYWPEVRFLSLLFATSLWAFVTVEFVTSGLQTMAPATFGVIGLTCFTLGIRVAWKSSSYH